MKTLIAILGLALACVLHGEEVGALGFWIVDPKPSSGSVKVVINDLHLDGYCGASPNLSLSSIASIENHDFVRPVEMVEGKGPSGPGVREGILVTLQIGHKQVEMPIANRPAPITT